MTFLRYVQSPNLTSSIIDEILEKQAVRLFQSLDRAAYERLNNNAGLRVFIVRRAIQEEIAAAAITSLVITEGIQFQFDEQIEKGLVALGLSETMIGVVRREVKYLSQHESLSDQYISRPWKLGKSIEFYSSLLREEGILVNDRHVLLIRRKYELLRAEILNEAEWRYSRLRTANEQMVRPYLAPPRRPAEYFRSREAPKQAETGAEPTIENDPNLLARSWNAPFPCAHPHEDTHPGSWAFESMQTNKTDKSSFTKLIEQMSVEKRQVNGAGESEWTQDVAKQHISVARFLAKVAGTDDPAGISQTNLDELVKVFKKIPKNYGKPAGDAAASLEEILARAAGLDARSVGIGDGTISRKLIQLNSCIRYVERKVGVKIGTAATAR